MCRRHSLCGSASRGLATLMLGSALLAPAACAAPAAPSSTATDRQVDVLDFLIGDAALWPRVGTQAQNQIVDRARQEVCWTKYGDPRMFECWRWNDQFVFHAVDHALDGNTGESYSFTVGHWLPRHISAAATKATPWILNVEFNTIIWFDTACRIDPGRSHNFQYFLYAWFEPQRDAGGDIGVRDTLVLEYAPGSEGNSTPEYFYFGRGSGWYEWMRLLRTVQFNRLGGSATPVDRSVRCSASGPAASY